MEQKLEGDSFSDLVKNKFNAFRQWLKPDPADGKFLLAIKYVYKSIVVLLLVAFSPVIIIILLFVFFAAL